MMNLFLRSLSVFLILFVGAITPSTAAPALTMATYTWPEYNPLGTCYNKTLQGCINTVAAGSIIQITPSSYSIPETTINKILTLTSVNPSTTLNPDGAHRVLQVSSSLGNGVTLSNLTINGGNGGFGGGINNGSGTTLTLVNVRLTNNFSNGNGGGVYSEGPLILSSVVATGNTAASYGGGIHAAGALTVYNSAVVSGNSAGLGGGGIFVYLPGTIEFLTVTGNTTNGFGGGMAVMEPATIAGGLFENNTAKGNGGGIRADTLLTLQAVEVKNNSTSGATSNGGGVYANGGLVMNGGKVSGNKSIGKGGGINAAVWLTMNTVEVSNNDSGESGHYAGAGGGIYTTGPLFMQNSTITGNHGLFSGGGGLYALSTAEIIGGRFEGNQSYTSGGGIYAEGLLTMTGTLVSSNSSGMGSGGGVWANGGVVMSGGQVTINTAHNNGGGIYARSVTLTGTEIDNNNAYNGGGIYSDGNQSLTDTKVHDNSASTGSGGGIYSYLPETSLTLTGTGVSSYTNIYSNTAAVKGGGIYAAGPVKLTGEVHFTDNSVTGGTGGAIDAASLSDNHGSSNLLKMIFDSNSASSHGGAVYSRGVVDLRNSPTFTQNTVGAAANGGAVYSIGDVTLSGGESSGNSANNGGAVYSKGIVAFNAHDTTANQAANQGGCAYAVVKILYYYADATGCSAGNNGGAAYAPEITLYGNGLTKFENNHASGYGGVAYATGKLTVYRAILRQNTAANGGGALYGGQPVQVQNSTFENNVAGGDGGALFSSGQLELIGNTFGSNQTNGVSSDGGAVYNITGPVGSIGNTFVLNSAGGSGGAAYLGNATIFANLFLSNSSGANAGGLYGLGAMSIDRSRFDSNQGVWNGAYFQAGPTNPITYSVTVTNSIFSRNSASNGANHVDLSLNGVNATLLNNTHANPVSAARGAVGIYESVATVRNCIFSNYSARSITSESLSNLTHGTNLYHNTPSPSIYGPQTNLGGNITADPHFVNPAGLNFHLVLPSPAVNKGVNLGLAVDYDGDKRSIGGKVDIGFDEVILPRFFLPVVMR